MYENRFFTEPPFPNHGKAFCRMSSAPTLTTRQEATVDSHSPSCQCRIASSLVARWPVRTRQPLITPWVLKVSIPLPLCPRFLITMRNIDRTLVKSSQSGLSRTREHVERLGLVCGLAGRTAFGCRAMMTPGGLAVATEPRGK